MGLTVGLATDSIFAHFVPHLIPAASSKQATLYKWTPQPVPPLPPAPLFQLILYLPGIDTPQPSRDTAVDQFLAAESGQ